MNLLCDGHALVCPRDFFLRLEPDVSPQLAVHTASVYFSLEFILFYTRSMADEGVASLLAYFSYTHSRRY